MKNCSLDETEAPSPCCYNVISGNDGAAGYKRNVKDAQQTAKDA